MGDYVSGIEYATIRGRTRRNYMKTLRLVQVVFIIVIVGLLAACSGIQLPFGKPPTATLPPPPPTDTPTATIPPSPTATPTPYYTWTPAATSTIVITVVANQPTPFGFATRTPVPYMLPTATKTPYWPGAYSAPANFTAICKDGTYSFARRRDFACLNHGGVQKWRGPREPTPTPAGG